jgi:L-ribulokinase
MCLPFKTYEPRQRAVDRYNELFHLYRQVYFAFGRRDSDPTALGEVLPELRRIAAQARLHR